MARQFGVVSTLGSSSVVILNSFNTKTSAEIAEARGTTGQVEEQKAYSVKKDISAQGILNGTFSNTAGTTLTVGSNTYLITDTDVAETNTGFSTVSINATHSDNATATAYSESSSGSGTSGTGD